MGRLVLTRHPLSGGCPEKSAVTIEHRTTGERIEVAFIEMSRGEARLSFAASPEWAIVRNELLNPDGSRPEHDKDYA